MKVCNKCNAQNTETANFCYKCGSSDLQVITLEQPQVTIPESNNTAQACQPDYTAYETQTVTPAAPDLGNGNVIAGAVGAFLFAIAGGLLYFLVYKLGFIAGICGLVIFVLANFGYDFFAKGNKNTLTGLIVSIIVTIVMIFIAEYVSLSSEIFAAFKDQGITFFDAVKSTPAFLSEPEIKKAVISDLLFAYAFGFLATISEIMKVVKNGKKS